MDGNPTTIHVTESGFLCFNGEHPLATREQYELADRSIGSIFEALQPGENIKLADGYFVLDEDLDLVQDWQVV